ncbi:MAG: RsmD family RNA methyltransferase [Rikenellaceae bacterium]|nr:RsmD family RNA methyltransferase [Rikenellaceae bacterium]
MRIVSGTCRGRIIDPPHGLKARPTTDFAKENIFNVLSNLYDFEGLEVLDLFSGTGSISYEFASRGAARVISVEAERLHHSFIAQTAAKMKLTAIKAVLGDAFNFVRHSADKFDIIFADPPYDLEQADTLPDMVMSGGLLNQTGMFILEHSKHKDFSQHPCFRQQRRYGSVNFSIFEP